MTELELILVDPQAALCAAFEQYFDGLPRVQIVNGVFQDVPEYDCIVSAANSFGLMDGGLDAAIIQYFGPALMRRVQDYILNQFLGEQPVGTSFVVETGHPRHRFLAHTPTMRVPMDISHTDYIYLAMLAMLRAVHQHNQAKEIPINIIACSGLGTGTGRVPPREAARQMALAYRNFLYPPLHLDWRFAEFRQSEIRFGGSFSSRFPMD